MNQKINFKKVHVAMEEASTETLEAFLKVLEAVHTHGVDAAEQVIRGLQEEQVRRVLEIMKAGLEDE